MIIILILHKVLKPENDNHSHFTQRPKTCEYFSLQIKGRAGQGCHEYKYLDHTHKGSKPVTQNCNMNVTQKSYNSKPCDTNHNLLVIKRNAGAKLEFAPCVRKAKKEKEMQG